MTKRPSDRKTEYQEPTPSQPVPTAFTEGCTTAPLLFFSAVFFLLLAAVASGLLVLDHFGGLSLPGCGKGSPCAQAAASAWGKVPLINWPVSFLGFAYFLGALVAWVSLRKGVTDLFRWLVRFGALVSLGFLIVIILGDYVCYYCLAVHVGNIAFWICVELSGKTAIASSRPVATVAGVFIASSIVLGLLQVREKRLVGEKQEREFAESVAQVTAASAPKPAPSQTAATQPQPPASMPALTTAPASAPSPDAPYPNGFTGRWRWGPGKAPIRIVMLTDYQCSDCYNVEQDVAKMMAERTDFSLSIKHFPMCADCNDHFKDQNMHPNACWAARAAEAAGILRGNDGFWQMHHWLFANKGSFTNEALMQGLRDMGYDPQQFVGLMTGDETLRRVKADIEEGELLGLHFTPMVFINGVEIKGVFTPQAIPRAVAMIAAKNPPPLTCQNDRPPLAKEKLIADWREQGVRSMPADAHPWPNGPDNAKVQIVIWADYQEKYSAVADGLIRKWMAGRSDAQYTFRHFPFNQACNSVVSRTAHPQACRASQAAEAAGQLGGSAGYWKMHEWLMTHQAEFNDDTLRQAAPTLGFNADALFAAMDKPETKAAIEEDVKAGKDLLYRGGIPTIYVNGRVIPRWRLEEEPVLDRILDEAAGKSRISTR